MGKVVLVFSPKDKNIDASDTTVQAIVRMWDSNMQTVSVESSLGEKIKQSDIVLIDYTPIGANIPMPRLAVSKILHSDLGKKAWKEYEDYFKERIKKAPVQPVQQESHRYIG